MQLITLLNRCQHFPGFVYDQARLCAQTNSIEIEVRPRRGSQAGVFGLRSSAAPAYDHQWPCAASSSFPLWGFAVLLLYRMRRVDCRGCGVKVEQVPWAVRQASR
ncbi:MAG: hypothetical protein MZW92_37155 [Comamonadaceae bacterium]|nr:hypothetical protein [Comamonadaceae bacterium]